MSWFSPITLSALEGGLGHASIPARSGIGQTRQRENLGAASATAWGWEPSSPAAPTPFPRTRPDVGPVATPRSVAEPKCLRAPVELLRGMAEAAQAQGRDESDVWMEAAREWLLRRGWEVAGPPASPAPAPRRIARRWDAIDALLEDLRGSGREMDANADRSPAA